MCYISKPNNKLTRLQESALRIVYNYKGSIFYQLFEKVKSVAILSRNLQYFNTTDNF